jgi:hypothetical protein
MAITDPTETIVVRAAGFEPARVSPTDFKSVVYAVPPHARGKYKYAIMKVILQAETGPKTGHPGHWQRGIFHRFGRFWPILATPPPALLR